MSLTMPPLSPSRHSNASPSLNAPPPPVAAPKKRMALEEEDAFAESLLAEAEQEGLDEEEDEMEAMLKLEMEMELEKGRRGLDGARDGPVASTSKGRAGEGMRKEVVTVKKKLVLELEDGMGDEDGEGATMEVDEPPPPPRITTFEITPVSATSFSGRKVTFRRRKKLDQFEESAAEKRENSLALARLSASMLDVPYHKMVAELERDMLIKKKALEADAANPALGASDHVDAMLWTDRYRPKKFTDLLGDERMHRQALLWLKEWDECVFRGTDKTTAAAELKRERRRKRARDFKGGDSEKGEGTADHWGRPHEKILLLSGPPGLGKTTLAHVLASQAGYRVHEVNASDDRTAPVVEQRIKNALESQAITSNGGLTGNKPTCLVIDEIDGASGDSGFIHRLVKLIEEGSKSTPGKGKGKGKEARPLLRPIICICNNLYAGVLRPLRPIAKIIRFNPPTNLMLVSRLRTICVDERMTVDSKNLTMLAETAEGDLRNCLNTLQFIKRNGATVSKEAIAASMVGKDMGTSSNVVVEHFFKKPLGKKGSAEQDDKWLNRIAWGLSTCGEYDKIAQGFFENYLGSRSMTDSLPRINESLDWMFFYERLQKAQYSGEYGMTPYFSYSMSGWYKLFSTYGGHPMENNRTDYETYLKKTAHEEITSKFTEKLPIGIASTFSGPAIILELLPMINRIIVPDIKPVNTQLIKADDRAVLTKLINTMLSLNLSYVHDKNEDGQLIYTLNPPVDVFIHFDGKRAGDVPASRYAVRHLINQEMKAEKLRRDNAAAGLSHTASDIIAAYNVKPQGPVVEADAKEAVDFFGRALVAKPPPAEEADAPPPPKRAKHAVYRFHEGFSNAVRVTKRVSDFLL